MFAKQKLDASGASEINRLYPESKKKNEEKCDIGIHCPRRGRLEEGEAERERNRSDDRRAEERRKGAISPKRSGEKECCNFYLFIFPQPE
ncbi:hypothetical protein TNCV_869381 [Trichonephila clavipes]|nr:hypothetical protein TNCV_869381 [Trichonephila clavipes]